MQYHPLECSARLVSGNLRDGRSDLAARSLSVSLTVAALLGLAILGAYRGAAVQLVQLTQCAPELWPPALLYLRVRALAMPANLVTMVAQAGTVGAELRRRICQLCAHLLAAAINGYCCIGRSGDEVGVLS